MAHDDIPEDRQQSFPCECGGSITAHPDKKWACNMCDFERPAKAKTPMGSAPARLIAWRSFDACERRGKLSEDAIFETARPIIEELLKVCANIARNGCLVPPDGGSPSEAESQMCEEIAKLIEAL